jgi:hypothetical protein
MEKKPYVDARTYSLTWDEVPPSSTSYDDSPVFILLTSARTCINRTWGEKTPTKIQHAQEMVALMRGFLTTAGAEKSVMGGGGRVPNGSSRRLVIWPVPQPLSSPVTHPNYRLAGHECI